MKVTPQFSELWLEASGLWSDVTLVVFGVKQSNASPNPTRTKLGALHHSDFKNGKVSLGAVALQNPNGFEFKFTSVEFRCQVWPTTLGRVVCRVVAKAAANSAFEEIAKFDLERQPGGELLLVHDEPIVA